jgi:hypothetical protein
MSDRFEGLQRLGTHPLSRRVEGYQFRIFSLQFNEFIKKLIIFRVRDLWLIQDIIKVVVAVNFFPKCPYPIGDFRFWFNHADLLAGKFLSLAAV